MNETMYGILWLIMIYSIWHFFVIQHNNKFSERTTYEQVVTWVAIVSLVLVMLWVMFG